jgi:hypothetical protein
MLPFLSWTSKWPFPTRFPHQNTSTLCIRCLLYPNHMSRPSYRTQNYWVPGLCPSSYILETRKQRFGNCICFRSQVKAPTHFGPSERADLQWVQWLRLDLSKGPNLVGVPPHEDGNRSSFRNVVFSLNLVIEPSNFVLYTNVRTL